MRILHIDDHALVRTALRKLLALVAGAEVLEAATGAEGLAMAQSTPST